ncbi:hypothetical protein ACH5RR_031073 [Cinchona calisaya]|uniref:Uncharacterized protein n=1 Tax=Cinchona calisaya TaxID=153742 RepID=A0ABD2YG56_9GENT
MANNNKMDNERLLKIGFEAIKMQEEEDQYGRKGTKPTTQACQYQYQPQQTRIFQNMARKNGAGLVEIAIDAFATLEEEYYGRTTMPPPRQDRQQPQPHPRANTQFVTSTKENGAMDCNQAARTFGGVLIKEADKRKPLLNPRRG